MMLGNRFYYYYAVAKGKEVEESCFSLELGGISHPEDVKLKVICEFTLK